jgi:hypothetical protein
LDEASELGGLIGTYKIPYCTVSEAIGVAATVVTKYNGRLSRSSLASELKMDEKGGAYINKLATFKQYGLLQGRDMLEATDLAQKIAISRDATTVAQSKANAFLAYPLFSELFGRVKAKLPDDDVFINFLREITGVDRLEASKKLPEIRKCYVDALQYLKAFDFEGGEPSAQQVQIEKGHVEQSSERMETMQAPVGVEEIKMGTVRIWLGRSEEDIATAEALIAAFKTRIGVGANQKPKSSHVNG